VEVFAITFLNQNYKSDSSTKKRKRSGIWQLEG
jgi:hypothetical protein